MVLFLHNRYRTTGGEERVVDELLRLVREYMGEPAELLERHSAELGQTRAAVGLLRGGLAPREVAKAVRLTRARAVHAHNLNPLFGWRALAAARAEGARVVLHLHQYRLVCATGVCFTAGRECTRCHGRNTLPGIVRNCRGSRGEALAYGASLAMWQPRLLDQTDAVIVPSVFARERLREIGAPLDFERVHVLAPPVRMLDDHAAADIVTDTRTGTDAHTDTDTRTGTHTDTHTGTDASGDGFDGPDGQSADGHGGGYALVVSRLAQEKGVDVAIDACRMAGVPLLVAGDGPEHGALRARVGKHDVSFVGHVDDGALARLRAGAALAIVPSRSAETFGMAAAEAMAAGVPVVASRIGALPELVDDSALAEPGDPASLAAAIGRYWGDTAAGERGRSRIRELCAPEAVVARLNAVYGMGPPVGRRV